MSDEREATSDSVGSNRISEAHLTSSIGDVTVQATAQSRVALALHHLLAACRNSVRVGEAEYACTGLPFEHSLNDILHDSMATAILSVSALEGYANELCFEGGVFGASMNSTAAESLTELVEREPILDKYAHILAVVRGVKLDRGTRVVQDVAALVELRHALVHFRPEWYGAEGRHKKLAQRLAHRFERSPLRPPGEPLFPLAWASASCARWACESTIAFIDHFYIAMKLDSPLESHRVRLNARWNNPTRDGANSEQRPI